MVPALLSAAIVAAVSLIFGIVMFNLAPDDSAVEGTALLGAILSAVMALVFLISAAGLHKKHWNDTCHRLGGVLAGGGCYEPHSKIHVP